MKKGVTIPATAATQIEDNVSKPFWAFKEETTDDFFDCYVSFKELDCQEYLWEWKSRKIDEILYRKLIDTYKQYFLKNQIGSNRSITITTSATEPLDGLGKLFMTIISSNDFAEKNKMHSPPISQVIYPIGTLGGMLRFTKLYNESAAIATKEFGKECNPKTVSLMPVHIFDANKNWFAVLNDYIKQYGNSFRQQIPYIRPVIPRAEIADKKGFVASVLATKRALASYTTFSSITATEAHPVIDAGPTMFRGGLRPKRVKEFIQTYAGARSVTIRPSFRYDNDIEEAKTAIRLLNRELPKSRQPEMSKENLRTIKQIEDIFSRQYRTGIEGLESMEVFPEELHVVKKFMNQTLHKSFALYSLGIPPEMIGTGRALVECIQGGLVKDLENLYPEIKEELVESGRLLNKENLRFLCKLNPAWKGIHDDIKLVEDFTGMTLGPQSTDDFLHRNHTSNIFHLWSAGKDFSRDLIAAAKARKCMG